MFCFGFCFDKTKTKSCRSDQDKPRHSEQNFARSCQCACIEIVFTATFSSTRLLFFVILQFHCFHQLLRCNTRRRAQLLVVNLSIVVCTSERHCKRMKASFRKSAISLPAIAFVFFMQFTLSAKQSSVHSISLSALVIVYRLRHTFFSERCISSAIASLPSPSCSSSSAQRSAEILHFHALTIFPHAKTHSSVPCNRRTSSTSMLSMRAQILSFILSFTSVGSAVDIASGLLSFS